MKLPWSRNSRHHATFSASTAYYTYCFSLPSTTTPFHLSNELLKRGLATAAVTAASDEIRVADRYMKLYRTKLNAQAVADLKKVKAGSLTVASWARAHPKFALRLIWTLGKKRLWPRKTTTATSGTPEGEADIYENMSETVNFIERAMADARIFLGAYHNIEREFYAPSYMELDPFIRLQLRGFRVTSEYFEDEEVLAFLMLHKSGVALLTFASAPNDKVSVDDVIKISRGDSRSIGETFAPQDLFGKDYPDLSNSTTPPDDVHDGVGWVRVTWPTKISFSDIFGLYLNRVLECCPKTEVNYSAWHCYPTIILNHLDCCNSRQAWLDHHKVELRGLLTRMPGYASLIDPNGIDFVPRDTSILRERSIFRAVSHCLEIRWSFGPSADRPSAIDDHWSLVLTEHVLLQYWQLQALDWRISMADWGSRPVERLQAEIAIGLDEYRQSQVVAFGTARDMAETSLAENGTHRMYERITDRLDALSKVVSSREARAGAKRNTIIASAAVIATSLFGLPAIDQSITLLKNAKTGTGFGRALRPIQSFIIHHPSTLWMGYFIAVFLSVILFVYGAMRPHSAKENKAEGGLPGIRWPGLKVEISRAEPSYKNGAPSMEQTALRRAGRSKVRRNGRGK